MSLNDLGTNFIYLLTSERDKNIGLTVNAVGFQSIPPHTRYPSTDQPSNYSFDPQKGRMLSEYQLIYISKGKGSFSTKTITNGTLEKGQVLLLFPGEWHTYCPLEQTGWNEYYIGFNGPIIDNLVHNGHLSPEKQILDVGLNEELVNLFTTAIKLAKEDKKVAQLQLAGTVFHLLGTIFYLVQNRDLETKEYMRIIERAKIMMTENIHNSIDIKKIAANLNVSYSWFRKMFKEYTGYAPAQYLQELKTRKAKELLIDTTLSIKEIAYKLNFDSYEYFFTFFKKRVGITPLEYRNTKSR